MLPLKSFIQQSLTKEKSVWVGQAKALLYWKSVLWWCSNALLFWKNQTRYIYLTRPLLSNTKPIYFLLRLLLNSNLFLITHHMSFVFYSLYHMDLIIYFVRPLVHVHFPPLFKVYTLFLEGGHIMIYMVQNTTLPLSSFFSKPILET